MLPSTHNKGGGWARGRSAAEPRSTSRPRASSRSRGSTVIPSVAARPSSSSAAKRSTSPPPVRAASVALPVTAQPTAWVPQKPVAFSPELAKWAHTLITAYHANNSKLGRMARSGLDQLEAWRQQVETREAAGEAGTAQSLHELNSMQQAMMLQLADLKQQLAAASAAEDAELLRGGTAAVDTTAVSSISQAASTSSDAAATSVSAASVAAIITADAPIATTAAAAVAAAATPADIITADAPIATTAAAAVAAAATPADVAAPAPTAMLGASTVPAASAAPTTTAADSYGVRLANWADGLITKHLGASLVLPCRKQSPHLSPPATTRQGRWPWEVAVTPIGPHLARTAREQHAVHGAAASSGAASLAQLQQRWEEELWLFKAEGDAVLRELEMLQQQHLAHITAVAATGEQDAWQEQWGKAHAEIRLLADAAAAGAVAKPTLTRLSVPASAAATSAAVAAPVPAALSSRAHAETEGGEAASASTKGAAPQQPYTGGRRAAKRADTRVRAVAERTSLARMAFLEADVESHSGTEQQATDGHQVQQPAVEQVAVQLPLAAVAAPAPTAPAPPSVLPSVVSAAPVAMSGSEALPSAFDALADNGDLPAVSRQEATALASRGKPAGWDVFGQLLYVALRKM